MPKKINIPNGAVLIQGHSLDGCDTTCEILIQSLPTIMRMVSLGMTIPVFWK